MEKRKICKICKDHWRMQQIGCDGYNLYIDGLGGNKGLVYIGCEPTKKTAIKWIKRHIKANPDKFKFSDFAIRIFKDHDSSNFPIIKLEN